MRNTLYVAFMISALAVLILNGCANGNGNPEQPKVQRTASAPVVLSSPTPTPVVPTPTPRPTATPEPTLTPTPEPSPTPTPVVPTPTPRPTATPEPTLTPNPSDSDMATVFEYTSNELGNFITIQDSASGILIHMPTDLPLEAFIGHTGTGVTADDRAWMEATDAQISDLETSSTLIGEEIGSLKVAVSQLEIQTSRLHADFRTSNEVARQMHELLTQHQASLAQKATKHHLILRVSGEGQILTVPENTVYDTGTTVTLSAEPSVGHQFRHWEINGSTAATSHTLCLSVMHDTQVTAVFVPFTDDEAQLERLRSQVQITGNGTVRVEPINSRATPGRRFRIIAQPEPGWKFARWMNIRDELAYQAEITASIEDFPKMSAAFIPKR